MPCDNFDFPTCGPTSYSITPVANESTLRCGKYTIRRKSTSVDVLSIDVTLSDVSYDYADDTDWFYEKFTTYGYFCMELDDIIYRVRFTSYNVSFSDLKNRKNITFTVMGIIDNDAW